MPFGTATYIVVLETVAMILLSVGPIYVALVVLEVIFKTARK